MQGWNNISPALCQLPIQGHSWAIIDYFTFLQKFFVDIVNDWRELGGVIRQALRHGDVRGLWRQGYYEVARNQNKEMTSS